MSDKIERFYFIPKEKGTPDNVVINCEEFAKRIVTNKKQNRMNNSWFEVKAKYTKQLEDGRLKRVNGPYLVDAVSFTDAEARIYEEVGESVKGEFIVVSIARKEFSDIFDYDDSDVWYQAKAKFETLDSDSGKLKNVTHNYLVSASNVEQANERIKDALKDYVIYLEITSVSLSKIVEVLPYTPKE